MDEPELDPKQRADSMKDADDDCLPRWLLNNVDVELETQLCVYPKREYAEPRGLEPNCDGDASLAPKIRTDVDLPLPSQLETLEDEGGRYAWCCRSRESGDGHGGGVVGRSRW